MVGCDLITGITLVDVMKLVTVVDHSRLGRRRSSNTCEALALDVAMYAWLAVHEPLLGLVVVLVTIVVVVGLGGTDVVEVVVWGSLLASTQ